MSPLIISMRANQILELESESPADREAKRTARLTVTRERNRKFRAEARAVGVVTLQLEIPRTLIDELDAIKKHVGLRNRSQAYVHIMAKLGAHPKLKQELGL